VAPKQLPKGESAPADYISTTPNFGVTAVHDRLYEVANKVSGIERSVTYLELRTEKMETKLDQLTLDVHSAKRIAIIFGSILSVVISAVGAVALLLLNKLLDIVVHHFNTPSPH
jgi:hypothetical protein